MYLKPDILADVILVLDSAYGNSWRGSIRYGLIYRRRLYESKVVFIFFGIVALILQGKNINVSTRIPPAGGKTAVVGCGLVLWSPVPVYGGIFNGKIHPLQ
jgi:hypothetical protein